MTETGEGGKGKGEGDGEGKEKAAGEPGWRPQPAAAWNKVRQSDKEFGRPKADGLR